VKLPHSKMGSWPNMQLLDRGEHSSLVQKFVNYRRKKFCNIDTGSMSSAGASARAADGVETTARKTSFCFLVSSRIRRILATLRYTVTHLSYSLNLSEELTRSQKIINCATLTYFMSLSFY
jgi:hypothetical protein